MATPVAPVPAHPPPLGINLGVTGIAGLRSRGALWGYSIGGYPGTISPVLCGFASGLYQLTAYLPPQPSPSTPPG